MINGPFPEVGSKGNMVGKGSGFLYYRTETAYFNGPSIIVGTYNGYNKSLAETESKSKRNKKVDIMMREKIENEIYGIK